MADTIVPGSVSLPVTVLKPLHSATVQFTPQEGLIQVTAFGVEIGATKPTGKPGSGSGAGHPGKPGGEDFPGIASGGPGAGPGDISIKQDVRIEAFLIPPAGTSAGKGKTFVIRDALGGGEAQGALELGVRPDQAGRTWTCRFTNRGHKDVRATGTVKFVLERHEDEEEPPAEVSVGVKASLPVSFLRPNDTTSLAFVPEAGVIEVAVFAAETHPGKPTGKPNANPDEGEDDFDIRQDARVRVQLVAPSGGVVATEELHSTRLFGGEPAPEPFLQHTVPAGDAGKPWQCRFTNRGKTDIRCAATISFVEHRLRTDLPIRILNNGLRQMIAAVGLKVRLDGKNAFVGVSDELRDFAGDSIGAGVIPIPASGPITVEFSDFNLFALAVRARTDTGRPVISGSVRFEALGEEIDDLRFMGIDVADVDIGRLAVTVDVELRTVEVKGGRTILPLASVDVDVSAFVDALSLIGVDISEKAAAGIRSAIEDVVGSSSFRDAVGDYLTQGFVHLAQQGHEFHDLSVDDGRFVVIHLDPDPDQPPPPPQPAATVFPRPADVKPVSLDDEARANLAKIDRIVILMQENRSFDHLLGYLSHPDHGLPRLQADPERDVPDGLKGDESNPRSSGGRPIPMEGYEDGPLTVFSRSVDPAAVPFGPHHEHSHVMEQIAEGTMRGFADDFISRFPSADPQFAMRFYTDRHLPVFDELAAKYLICDRWFASHPGPTQPNRFCTLSGHTPTLENFALDDPILGYLRMPTIFDVLTEAGVDWTYYEGDIGFLRMYDRYRLDDTNVIPFDDPADGFVRRAELGLLPHVTFIDPNFSDVPPAATANDDHPPADLRLGQQLIRLVHDTLVQSSQWTAPGGSGMLLVITYDEHGGFYDHVPPPGTPPAEDPKPQPLVHPEGEVSYGARVPTFVISPFVPAGKVNSTTFDHISLLATILHRFVGDIPADLGPRVATANHLASLLTLDEARRPGPLDTRPAAAAGRRFTETRADPHDFRATMRALARPNRR